MIKSKGIFDAFDEFLAIFNMGPKVTHFRVEDVAEAMLTHELVR